VTKKPDFPCKGCITALPDATSTTAPLLVVLHGDGGAPKSMLGVWEKPALARGIIVFAPKCPVDDGCTNASWWQWGKDPSWLDAQIDAIDKVRPIDRARVWGAGWSGGASWFGWRAPDLVGRFAAVSIDGGGMMPHTTTCDRHCSFDAHFLTGDKNPLHSLVVDLRAWMDGCAAGEVKWELLPGKDHGGEWVALTKPGKADEILDWFATKTMTCAATSVGADTGADADSDAGTNAGADASIDDASPTSVNTSSTSSPPPSPPPAPRCACGFSDVPAALAVAIVFRRRARDGTLHNLRTNRARLWRTKS
jgi:poly(3-hydroxybutyrate) depolymerase